MITKSAFNKTIYGYYSKHGRKLPWRYEKNPYKIFVSEVMLQQTQVSRVLIKYTVFIQRFPSFQILAKASLSEVLSVWQGMGYNRRAKYLLESARIISKDKRYVFLFSSYSDPNDPNEHPNDPNKLQKILCELPGIGHATAGAILAYAFNIPTIFIETNIRTVFLHFLVSSSSAALDEPGIYKNNNGIIEITSIDNHIDPRIKSEDDRNNKITDDLIYSLIEQFLDNNNPRKWYYAVTDYGWMLKKQGFSNTISKQYKKQSKFEGSVRKTRGEILRELLKAPKTEKELMFIVSSSALLHRALKGLEKDKMVRKINNKYVIGSS